MGGGAEFKKTLENIVYAPLGGVEQIDYQGGKRRALEADRIGEMDYLGQDGKTAAGAGNPPMVLTEGNQKHLVPMIVPLTGYTPAPDLRPGGADVPPVSGVVLGTVTGRIALQTNRDGNIEVYVMNGDGSGLTNLTDNPSEDSFPVWSRDGKQIGFTSERDNGNPEIYVMNADGSNPTRLTHGTEEDTFPHWSPDGKQIVYTSGRGGEMWDNILGNGSYEIYVMNANGSNRVQLTNSPGPKDDNMDPRWSPDGTQIIFWSSRDGNKELYVMNADGSDQTRLTNTTPANSSWSSWH